MKGRLAAACLAVLAGIAFAMIPAARAEHTRSWRQADFSDFEKGTANGVAIRSDGRLVPAPRFAPFADPNLAYAQALLLDSHGRLYAAGGPDAKVLRFDDSGKATTVFESSELAVRAIVFDEKDNLYVGTSPDGKVYKVTPDGQKSVFFEPKTKYIWTLALSAQGTLFVATGDKGQVFAVTPDGKGQLFYQSDERHARSLAFDAKGNLLIGTEPDGLILRVPIEQKKPGAIPQAGESFALYETSKGEVDSLVEDTDGNLYAAAIGEKAHIPGAPVMVQTVAPPPPVAAAPAGQAQAAQAQVAAPQPAALQTYIVPVSGGTEIVKIAPDGSPETVWTSPDSLVFAMALSPEGKLLLGTGDKGEIIEIEGHHTYSSIAKTDAAQVTSFVAGPSGKMFAATANPGKIFALGPGFEPEGSFESSTFDAKIFSRWGQLTWGDENGASRGKAQFYARSGNTSNPDKNWSAWAGPYDKPEGETVDAPPARFAQWKVVFRGVDQADSRADSRANVPSISWVSLSFLPKNVAPVIDDIALQDPGVRATGFPAGGGGPGTGAPVQLRMPHGPGANPSPPPLNGEPSARTGHAESAPQGFEEKGYQSVLWSAHDDNDDDLVFSIYYRGEGEKDWRLLKDKLDQRYYSWDTNSMPDGAYYLKIVASDSPSNPPDQALSAERESGRFEVENTPPRIENLRAETSGAAATITFDAISSGSTIAQAQYSLDAGDWRVVFPAGLLSDAPQETYRIELSDLAPGEHVIAAQITDRFGNTVAAKAVFTITRPPSP